MSKAPKTSKPKAQTISSGDKGPITGLFGYHKGNDDDGAIVVDVGGVRYALYCTDTDQQLINAKGKDSEVLVYVHQIVSENASKLFAFLDLDTRRAFIRTIKIDGIGPATALSVLSKLGEAGFKNAVAAGDVATLQSVDGIGPKLAVKLAGVKL